MAAETILLDTSVIIDFFRKSEKSKSILYSLTDKYNFTFSVINVFEIEIGLKTGRHWQDYETLLENVEVLPIDKNCINHAVQIYKDLKSKNAVIELADLLIGATALANSLSLATLNQKHFKNITGLDLIEL